MLAAKVWRLWGSYTHGTYQRTRGLIRALHLALLAFGLAGLAAGLVATRRAELWTVAALLLLLTAMNAVLVSEARHNLTVMPALIAGGAMGFRLAAGRLRRPQRVVVPEGDHVVAAVHPARRPQTAPAVSPLPPG
jgi:predicted MFS family arabinose efflux permease